MPCLRRTAWRRSGGSTRKSPALEKTVAIYQDRLRALSDQLKDERQARREEDRLAAIKIIEKKLAQREELATELEAAIRKVEECYFALIGFPGIAADWPFAMTPGFGRIDLRGIQKEVSWAMYSAGRPINGHSRLPAGRVPDPRRCCIKPESSRVLSPGKTGRSLKACTSPISAVTTSLKVRQHDRFARHSCH